MASPQNRSSPSVWGIQMVLLLRVLIRASSFISYVDIFSMTGIADFATLRLLAKTGGRTPRIVSERQYACYTDYVHIEGDFQ